MHYSSRFDKDMANFVAKCIVCKQVKAEHLRPGGLSQEIELPSRK